MKFILLWLGCWLWGFGEWKLRNGVLDSPGKDAIQHLRFWYFKDGIQLPCVLNVRTPNDSWYPFSSYFFLSEKTLFDKIWMQSCILWETDVSGGLSYAEGGLLFKHLMLLGLVMSSSWDTLSFSGEKFTVVFGDGVLGRFRIIRLINHVLGHVGARTYGFAQVEVFFHTFIANSFVFIIRIIERMGLVSVDVGVYAGVWEGLLDVIVVFGTRGHLLGADSCEIKLTTITNTFFIHLVFVAGLVD